jgi:hypothetical protein
MSRVDQLNWEDVMGFATAAAETLNFVPGGQLANEGLAEPARNLSPPSPEEGHHLIRDFLRIERADLRQEVFRVVAEMLRVQESN